MLVAELTPYGQSVVSTHVTIDGIILLSEYLLNIDSLTNISSYTTLLDEDACGNISKSNGYVKVLDTSESVYQARTLLFYSLSGSTKNIVAGCSQSEAIVNKTSSALNIQVPVDLSCFTNGFIFSSIQSGYHTASDNIDGVVHIDDPSLDSDDTYSVYSKPQVDTLLSNKQSSLEAGDGISLSDNIVRTTGIPFGICDSTSTATKFTVTVPGIYKLDDGVTCMVKNGVVTSASGFTLNVNGLGAKPCYTNLAAATRETTIFNVAYTMLFVYDSTRVSGGCWICYRGYDSNTNTVGYQLRTNSTVMNVSDTARYYKLYFTSANGNLWVPASVNSTNDTTTARAVNQRPINPFGRIVYTSANTNYATGANLAATTIWDQYNLALGYSFNVNGGTLALTAEKPVYVKCAPQTDGSAIIDAANPTVQDLPASNDGKIYIFLGTATSATAVELFQNHPVYYHDGNGIKLWSGVVLPSKISDLTNDSGFITEEDIPTNISAFNNDAGYLTSFTETDPTVPSWAKQTTKPAYNLDEVADGSTRKLSNYVPTTRKVNNKALSSDVTLTLDDIADGTTRTIPIVNNSTITIKKNSDDTGDSFTTNTASGKTINLGLSTVASSGSYNDLSDKPTIPTVNNATLTIQKNGTTVKTFTANASSNVTANITVPTTTSQLTNNSGFITSADLPTNVSQLNNDVGYITSYTETDPTVPAWAKQTNKPTYTLDEVSDGTTRKLSDYVRIATTNRENQTIESSVTIHPKHNTYNNYRVYVFDGTDLSARTSVELVSWELDANNTKHSIQLSIRPEPYAGTYSVDHYEPAEYIRLSTIEGDQISRSLLWITKEFDANSSRFNVYGDSVASYSSISGASLNDGRLTTVDYVNAKSKPSNWYAVCSTGASTKAKKITIPGFTLETGAKVTVKFTATNSASAPTLTVNDGTTDSEAKPICYRGTSAVTTGNYYKWQANDILDLVYDGTNWIIVGWQTYVYYSTVASYATYVGNGSSGYVAYSNNGSAGSRALLPRADVTTTDWVDLGSTAKRWKTLYLTDSISDGTNTFSLPDKSGTLAVELGTYVVSSSPLGSSLIQSGKDYRQPEPSGTSFTDNPKWRGKDVSIGISQYVDLSENSRISIYVPHTTYVGSIAFLSALGASTYSAYPLYFRGDSSAHNATVPGGSILRLTFREDAFYNDFYDLADFGVEHEPIVRVGKLPHNQQTDNYNGALVGVRSDNGKLDKILNVSKSGSTVTETLTSLHTSSPIYVSFMGECFSAHPRVPFGLILNLDYIYNAGDSPRYENIPFLYIENGSIVSLSSSIQSHVVTSSTGKRYFHVNNAPVYLSYRPIGPNSNVYISIGGPYSGYTGAQGTTLLGFLPSNESEAGLLRLVNCFTPKNYADQALNAYNANFSSTAYMLVQGNSSGGSAGLVCGTELSSYVDIKPGTNKNNALSLGSTTYRWKDIYVNGSSSSYYLEIGNDTSGSTHSTNQPVIRPTTNGVGYLGTSDYHLSTAYINNLYVTSSGTSIASYIESQISSKISGTGVGSICLLNVSITNSSSSVATVSRGSLLNSNSNLSVSTLYIASPHFAANSSATPSSYSNTVGCYYSGSASGTSGAYKLLSSLYVPANTTKRYIVLAIRVS